MSAAFSWANASGGERALLFLIYFAPFFLYALITLGCWFRGRYVGRSWLVVFPVLAVVVDVLIPIPLVPTILNLVALMIGILGRSGSLERDTVL